MKSFFKILSIFVVIIILTVFLAPVFYQLLPMFKFTRIVNRIIQVLLVAAILIFGLKVKVHFRECGLDFRKWGKYFNQFGLEYGINFKQSWKRILMWGIFSGFFAILFITLFEVWFGPRYLRSPLLAQDIIERFFKGALAGAGVGIVEEFLFRGFVFVNLERKIKTFWAIILISVFYSLVHFLDNGQVFVPSNPSAGEALMVLVGYFEPLVSRWREIIPEFFGLFLFGVVLNVAFVRTRSLFFSIGIHAGAVFCIKFQNSFFRKAPEIYHPFYGDNPHYDGPFEWLVMVVLIVIIYYAASLIKKEETPL
jgi:membrane protease YdiL (CAAX protease family)